VYRRHALISLKEARTLDGAQRVQKQKKKKNKQKKIVLEGSPWGQKRFNSWGEGNTERGCTSLDR